MQAAVQHTILLREIVAKPNTKDYLILFGRYPQPGRTKTRLIPALGPTGAAAVQKRLTEQIMGTARVVSAQTGVNLMFCYDGGNRQKLGDWLDLKRVACIPQATGDLGDRMRAAIAGAFQRGAEHVILIGTDIPELSSAILKDAFQQIRRHDLVIGPSTDGGYWLVGMNRPADIFNGIPWSTPAVLKQTLTRARRMEMRIHLLDPLSDLDEPGDLDRTEFRAITPRPYLSVIVPVLNEAGHLAETLARAASPDAEIIVCDGGSTDATTDIAVSSGARLVHGEPGRARQQNRGAEKARGDVLLFLHADTQLPQNYETHIFETLMNRQVVLGAFRFQANATTSAMRWIAFWTNVRASLLRLPYGDQGLFMFRHTFEAIGGFPQVPIAEDLYLVRRLARKGRIALASATAVTSARRWQKMGPLRTTLINTIVALGCLSGINPERLAPLYHLPGPQKQP